MAFMWLMVAVALFVCWLAWAEPRRGGRPRAPRSFLPTVGGLELRLTLDSGSGGVAPPPPDPGGTTGDTTPPSDPPPPPTDPDTAPPVPGDPPDIEPIIPVGPSFPA